jgi:hypothetical protein
VLRNCFDYSVKKSTKDEIIEYLKNVCDKCNFKGKSENNLKEYLSKENKIICKLCEYRSTTKQQLKRHDIKEHHDSYHRKLPGAPSTSVSLLYLVIILYDNGFFYIYILYNHTESFIYEI